MNGDLMIMFDAFYPIVMITLGLGVGYALGVLHGRKIERIALSKQWANSFRKSTPAGG